MQIPSVIRYDTFLLTHIYKMIQYNTNRYSMYLKCIFISRSLNESITTYCTSISR